MLGDIVMNYQGIIIGAAAFLLIGVFHPIVIKVEYYTGKKSWPIFLIFGIGLIALSLTINSTTISAIVGVTGFSCLWSIREVFEQEERVKKGWFPNNPNKNNTTKMRFIKENVCVAKHLKVLEKAGLVLQILTIILVLAILFLPYLARLFLPFGIIFLCLGITLYYQTKSKLSVSFILWGMAILISIFILMVFSYGAWENWGTV